VIAATAPAKQSPVNAAMSASVILYLDVACVTVDFHARRPVKRPLVQELVRHAESKIGDLLYRVGWDVGA
jgi:hypothetical protein